MGTNTLYIASCSFGKDSIATILTAMEHDEPLDHIVFVEVMFDHKRGISGEIPEHIAWVNDYAAAEVERLTGVKVDIVRAKDDYVGIFYHTITKGKREGKTQGFLIGGRCRINRDCKIKAVHDYYKQFADYDVTQYVGIAADEVTRLARLEGSNKVSLLAKYGITEADAKAMCKSYNLLSPIYATSTRGGCWFCPNMRVREAAIFRQKHADLWNELRTLAATDNLVSQGFRYGVDFYTFDRKLEAMNKQQQIQFINNGD